MACQGKTDRFGCRFFARNFRPRFRSRGSGVICRVIGVACLLRVFRPAFFSSRFLAWMTCLFGIAPLVSNEVISENVTLPVLPLFVMFAEIALPGIKLSVWLVSSNEPVVAAVMTTDW